MFISGIEKKEEGRFFGGQSLFQIDCFATTLPYFSADVLLSLDIFIESILQLYTDDLLFFHGPEWKLEALHEEGAGEILCGVYK